MSIDVSKPIPIVDGQKISREEFEKNYVKPQKPVILRGLWKQYPAYAKWNYALFKTTMGEEELGLYSSTKPHPSKTMSEPTVKMKFSEYLQLIEKEPTDLRLFLFPIFKYKPELLKDFDYPAITKNYVKLPFMFFGPKNAITRMHQDIDMSNVFLTQFEGKKRVVLFPPDQSDLLYRLPFNVHSTVDIDKPDYKEYPALKYAKGLTGILEYGDTLFMPSGYWHHIEYVEGGYGLSVRSLPPQFSVKLKGFYNLTIQRKLDDMLRFTFGNKWFELKKSIAKKRAERAIKRMHKNNAHSGDLAFQ